MVVASEDGGANRWPARQWASQKDDAAFAYLDRIVT